MCARVPVVSAGTVVAFGLGHDDPRDIHGWPLPRPHWDAARSHLALYGITLRRG